MGDNTMSLYISLRGGRGHLDLFVSLWPKQHYHRLLCGHSVDPGWGGAASGMAGTHSEPTVQFTAPHSRTEPAHYAGVDTDREQVSIRPFQHGRNRSDLGISQ